MLPGILSSLLGCCRGGDLGVDLVGVGGPVPYRGPDQPRGKARVGRDERENVFLAQLRLGGAGGPDRADDLPYVGSADESGAPAGRSVPEDDSSMLGHPQTLVNQPVR